MLNSYSRLLETTLKQYQIGCAKPIELGSSDLFHQILQTQIKSRLSLTEQALISQGGNTRDQAVIAARRGQFATAQQLFAEAHAPLESNLLSREARLLYESFLEQSESYLDYRLENFDQVRIRIDNALAIDTILEEEYGYGILHIHRIQLLHNIVRTYARQMWLDCAVELASQLLAYLQGVLEELPFSGSWSSEQIARQSPEVVAATFTQISCEIAIILAGKKRQIARYLLTIAHYYVQLQANSKSQDDQQAYAWFIIKQAFVDNNIATFLEKASQFLALGRTQTFLLWYAIVVDIVTLCDEIKLPEAKLLRQKITKDAVKWEYLPQRFLPLMTLKSAK
ncbi:hypothetical protein [Scytonema sp. PRP1]|uniref:hypothetical protein n=1 Tax=Scytonema sp. PRP1 TaxID=3120513 RepID=UPI002FD4ED1D